MIYTIKNKDLEVKINSIGCELNSVKYKNKERLYQANETWKGYSPILFPVSGNVKCYKDGIKYDMPKHGIVRRREFNLVSKTDSSITFSFNYSLDTLKEYPYKFNLELTFKVSNNKLYISYKLYNLDEIDLPYSFGGHESYIVDDINNYSLFFEKLENLTALDTNDLGQLNELTTSYGFSNTLKLKNEYFYNDYSLIFKGIKSRSISLIDDRTGEVVAKTNFKGFNNLLVWKKYDDHFICIEPWMALPDIINKENKELNKKYGFKVIKPNESKKHTRVIEYFD